MQGTVKVSAFQSFLPCRKVLCTSVLIYPTSSFQKLCQGFQGSFLCRFLRESKKKKHQKLLAQAHNLLASHLYILLARPY